MGWKNFFRANQRSTRFKVPCCIYILSTKKIKGSRISLWILFIFFLAGKNSGRQCRFWINRLWIFRKYTIWKNGRLGFTICETDWRDLDLVLKCKCAYREQWASGFIRLVINYISVVLRILLYFEKNYFVKIAFPVTMFTNNMAKYTFETSLYTIAIE